MNWLMLFVSLVRCLVVPSEGLGRGCHSGLRQNPDELKLKVVTYCGSAKHMNCLDSDLRQNDGWDWILSFTQNDEK